MRRRLDGLVAGGLAAAVLCACGSSSAGRAPAPATLAAGAVPYLPSTRKLLSARFLAREAQAPALAAGLNRWGYLAGADRYFQGESKRLQVVDSRTLRFRGASGASAFIGFMRSHLGAYLGTFPRIGRLAAPGGRVGVLAAGQECQCHLANPSFLALVSRGGTVTWLEINGPGATRSRLAALLARAP
jgi:hypothetical protein